MKKWNEIKMGFTQRIHNCLTNVRRIHGPSAFVIKIIFGFLQKLNNHPFRLAEQTNKKKNQKQQRIGKNIKVYYCYERKPRWH